MTTEKRKYLEPGYKVTRFVGLKYEYKKKRIKDFFLQLEHVSYNRNGKYLGGDLYVYYGDETILIIVIHPTWGLKIKKLLIRNIEDYKKADNPKLLRLMKNNIPIYYVTGCRWNRDLSRLKHIIKRLIDER